MSQQNYETVATAKGAAAGVRALVGILLVVCAASLGGCVTSLDEGASAPDLQSGSVAAGATPKTSSKASKPIQLADASGSVPAAARAAGASDGTASGYAVGPLDVLEISVFKVPELSKSVQVADTGTINMPLLGEVRAAGKTAQEIEQDLTRQLGAKYLKSPQVTVFVKEHNSQTVTIEGAVMKPGVYPIQGKLSLVRLVATAGGLNNDLYEKNVTIFRTIDGARSSNVVNIDEIRAGKDPDPALHEGDVVVIDNNAGKVALQTTLKIVPGAASIGMMGVAVGD
jgi:polysaccharide export outer membrane protein